MPKITFTFLRGREVTISIDSIRDDTTLPMKNDDDISLINTYITHNVHNIGREETEITFSVGWPAASHEDNKNLQYDAENIKKLLLRVCTECNISTKNNLLQAVCNPQKHIRSVEQLTLETPKFSSRPSSAGAVRLASPSVTKELEIKFYENGNIIVKFKDYNTDEPLNIKFNTEKKLDCMITGHITNLIMDYKDSNPRIERINIIYSRIGNIAENSEHIQYIIDLLKKIKVEGIIFDTTSNTLSLEGSSRSSGAADFKFNPDAQVFVPKQPQNTEELAQKGKGGLKGERGY